MTVRRGLGEQEEGRQPLQIGQQPELVGATELRMMVAVAQRHAATAEVAATAAEFA